jgi:hypothetical protein
MKQLALLLVLLSSTAFAQTARIDIRTMVIAKEKEVINLSVRADLEPFSYLLSDDVLAVYDTGYASKGEVLSGLKKMTDIHFAMDDVRVIPICDSAGLVIYRMTEDWKQDGNRLTREYYVSSLWVEHSGKWTNKFWQETDKAKNTAPILLALPVAAGN